MSGESQGGAPACGWKEEHFLRRACFACPMVDIHTIGAGGGSIASIDAGEILRVGPESAGSRARTRLLRSRRRPAHGH